MKFTQQTIKLTLSEGKTLDTTAKVIDDWAIHKTVGYKGVVYSDRWTITHIPTGGAILEYFKREKHAKESLLDLLTVLKGEPIKHKDNVITDNRPIIRDWFRKWKSFIIGNV